MLTALLRKRFKMRGAEAFVRREGFEAVNQGLEDYDAAEGDLADQGFTEQIRNPAGFLVWLVRQRREASCGRD